MDDTVDHPADDAPHQADPARRRRLRWRSRRGLLENDLILTRFLDRNEDALMDEDVAGLHELLDFPDNLLMDLVLARREPEPGEISAGALRVLHMLRAS